MSYCSGGVNHPRHTRYQTIDLCINYRFIDAAAGRELPGPEDRPPKDAVKIEQRRHFAQSSGY